MKKFAILYIAVTLFSVSSFSQSPQLGQKAPQINITGFATTPQVTAVKKIIVLEFWTTWCAPCVAAIPHLNDLEEKFSGKINFLSITNENVLKIKDFLSRHVMRSQVVSDTTRITFNNYGIKYIPETFVIDTNGLIVWHGAPLELNEKILNDILSGQTVRSPDTGISTLEVPWAGNNSEPDELISINVKLIRPDKNLGRFSSRECKDSIVTAKWFNYSLDEIFADLNKISTSRVYIKNSDRNNNVAVTLIGLQSAIDADSIIKAIVINNLGLVFGFKPQRKMIEKEVYELTLSDTKKLNKYLDHDKDKGIHTSNNKEVWIGVNVGVTDFVKAFEENFKVLLSDQTGTKENYALQFSIQDLTSSIVDLETNYGIKLTKKKMKTEIWVLDFTKI